MEGINLKAVLAGVVFDFVSSVAFLIVLAGAVVALVHAGGHVSPDQLKVIGGSVYVKMLNILGITLCTAGGGFISARMSKRDGIRNSLVTGTLLLVLQIALSVLTPNPTPMWQLLMGFVLVLPASWCGGYIATELERRRP